MINLFLTILCSTIIALILKYNDSRKGESLSLLLGNYLTASIGGLIMLKTAVVVEYNFYLFLFGLLMGGMFVSSFFIYTKAVKKAGVSLSTVSSRISVIIPILLSIFFFKEFPSLIQIGGILFAVLTIYLFYRSLQKNDSPKHNNHIHISLILLLISMGLGDFGMKIFERMQIPTSKSFFLLTIFFSAFCYTFISMRVKYVKIDKSAFFLGLILGIPNLFSSFFLIESLKNLSAIIVYPLTNIGIIIATTIGAVLIFKENIKENEYWALLAGCLSIVLLSIN